VALAGESPVLMDAVAELVASQPWAEVVERDEAVLAAAQGRGLGAARGLAGAEAASPSEAVKRARGHDGATLALARALGAQWLDRYVSDWRNVRLDIDGDDLIAAGIPEGPAIGRGLAAAMRAKLDGEAVRADDQLSVALAAARR
jgi:tRNA nucleotidyltransferase (CCA-adding enzyme)